MDNRIRYLAEGGIALALASVLSMLSIFNMPQGGSVSASMTPIIFFSMRWGIGKGVIVGVLYGLINFMIAPYFFTPLQFILDYILAYGALALAGIAKNHDKTFKTITLSTILAISMRGFIHIISGMIFFADYGGRENSFIYSAIYNFSYLIPEMIITIILLLLLNKPLSNFLNRSGN